MGRGCVARVRTDQALDFTSRIGTRVCDDPPDKILGEFAGA